MKRVIIAFLVYVCVIYTLVYFLVKTLAPGIKAFLTANGVKGL